MLNATRGTRFCLHCARALSILHRGKVWAAGRDLTTYVCLNCDSPDGKSYSKEDFSKLERLEEKPES